MNPAAEAIQAGLMRLVWACLSLASAVLAVLIGEILYNWWLLPKVTRLMWS